MSITRWDPARDFVSLREAMDRLFEDSVLRPSLFAGDGRAATFPVDLYENDDNFVLKATLPGVRPEQLDVNATSDGVSIKAETKADTDVKEEHWLLRERRSGTLTRSFALPTQIDPDRVEASFEHGVLTLTLPKAEAVKPRQVKVKTAVEARSR